MMGSRCAASSNCPNRFCASTDVIVSMFDTSQYSSNLLAKLAIMYSLASNLSIVK
jgi:hypothetical protein